MNKIKFYDPVLPQTSIDRKVPSPAKNDLGPDFKEVLRQKLPPEAVVFSSHCLKRLEQNNIQVTPQQMDKLNGAVDKANKKGAKETCIYMDDMAFIVSINNRTVITVVDGPRMRDSVFTNIDSAVIL